MFELVLANHCAFSLPALAWLVKSTCCLSVCLSKVSRSVVITVSRQ